MKDGKNKGLEFVLTMIKEYSNAGPFIAKVIKISPLTIQPLMKTKKGEKYHPISNCRMLKQNKVKSVADGKPIEDKTPIKVGDDVLAIITQHSLENYKNGKFFIDDETRQFSMDNAVVLGVIE